MPASRLRNPFLDDADWGGSKNLEPPLFFSGGVVPAWTRPVRNHGSPRPLILPQ